MQKIAIVDDAADNRDFLVLPAPRRYHVLTYASGEDALNHLQQDPPDLIIMDIRLHGIDGIAVLQHLRRDAAARADSRDRPYSKRDDWRS